MIMAMTLAMALLETIFSCGNISGHGKLLVMAKLWPWHCWQQAMIVKQQSMLQLGISGATKLNIQYNVCKLVVKSSG